MSNHNDSSATRVDKQDETPGMVSERITYARENGVDVANEYTVTTVLADTGIPPEIRTYEMPVQDLHGFCRDYARTPEVIVDIRPTSG
jgi:hypothetical protein